MRQYNIQEVDLWFVLKKSYVDDDWTITTVLYWNWRRRDFRKESAKVYLFEDKAISSLMVAKKKWNEPC